MNLLFFNNIDPVFFSIGSFEIRYYGVLFATTMLLTYWLIRRLFAQKGFPSILADEYAFYMSLSTVICARLAHVIFYDPGFYFSNPIEILMIRKGGIASHGVIPGIFLGALIVYKLKKFRPYNISYHQLTDFIFPLTITGACIRIGNFLNSEIVGKVTSFPLAISYDYSRYQLPGSLTKYYKQQLIDNPEFRNTILNHHAQNSVDLTAGKLTELINSPNLSDLNFIHYLISTAPRHASQVYEIVSYFITFSIIWWVFKNKSYPAGVLTYLALILFFLFRFINEFFKEFQSLSPSNSWLTMGQYLSIPMILFSIGMIIYLFKKEKTKVMVKS